MIRAVLFDLDGTLVDSNDLHLDAWDIVFREAGIQVDRDAIRGQIGKGGDLLVPTLAPGLDEDAQEELADRHGAVFKERFLDTVRPFPDATALVRRVHASGARVVLASSASGDELDHYVDLLGIGELVAAATTSDDVETTKPAPDIFGVAIGKLDGIDAAEAIVIGDTPYDIEAAAKAGMRAIAVRSGGFDDAALAGAVAIYDGAGELLAGWEQSPLAG
jgi:membrane protein